MHVRNEEIKLLLLSDNMIYYIGNQTHKKLFKLISMFNNVAEITVLYKKLVTFMYSSKKTKTMQFK